MPKGVPASGHRNRSRSPRVSIDDSDGTMFPLPDAPTTTTSTTPVLADSGRPKISKASELPPPGAPIVQRPTQPTSLVEQFANNVMASVTAPVAKGRDNDELQSEIDDFTAAPISPKSPRSALKRTQPPPPPPPPSGPGGNEQHAINVKMYQGYRDRFGERIAWQFKSDRELASVHPAVLLSELEIIRTLLNSSASSPFFKFVMLEVAKFVETVSIRAGNPDFLLGGGGNLESFSNVVSQGLDNKLFDDEIDQIIIENPGWFSQDPKWRLLGKMSTMMKHTVDVNANRVAIARQSAQARAKATNLDL